MFPLQSILIPVAFKLTNATIFGLHGNIVLGIKIQKFAVGSIKVLIAQASGIGVLLVDREIAGGDLGGNKVRLTLAPVGTEVNLARIDVEVSHAIFRIPSTARITGQGGIDGIRHVTGTGLCSVGQGITGFPGQLAPVGRFSIGIIGWSSIVHNALFDGNFTSRPPKAIGTGTFLHQYARLGKVTPIFNRSWNVGAKPFILAFQITG